MRTIAIVGKPNVGKSTLFNRIIKKRKSIVDDTPGVTRDRIYGDAEWLTRRFELIDTGGLTVKDATFKDNIEMQVNFAIDESQVIIFIVSHKDGIDMDDDYVAKMLKQHAKTKKIILVVNKAESNKANEKMNQFYQLGFGKPFLISAEHGIGVGDLLDEIVGTLPAEPENNGKDSFKFCIIGKPNVGKSSLTNTILREERVIVSDVAGTTRDSIDSDFKYQNKEYTIIDTAGIRRKGKIREQVEKYSVIRAEGAIRRSKVILVMIDGSEPFTEQDEIIGGLAYSANIPTIIVVNKWDLVKKDNYTMNQFTKLIRSKFKYLAWAPIVFISSFDNKRVHTIFETLDAIEEQLNRKISTSLLNETILKAQMMQQPPGFKGGRLNISYATQVKSQIPTFVIFVNNPKYLHFSYGRYVENKLREVFGLDKVPMTLYWKDKNSRIRGGNR